MSTLTAEQILEQVQAGSLSIVEAQEKLAQLKLGELKKMTYKVSPKGAISFYGLRKMPITLYKDELDSILEMTNKSEFQEFLVTNADKLSSKEKNRDK